MITKELIERFFRNECTAEEQRQVLDFIKERPEEFAQFFDENEWERFEAVKNMDSDLSKRLFERVRRQTTGKIRTKRIVMRGVAVAASVLFAIGLSWVILSTNEQAVPIAKNRDKESGKVSFAVRHVVNTTAKEKRIELEDGSFIFLGEKSEITYQVPFGNRRDITLIGKAFFKIAKDKTRPFTVTSGDIATTALGTEFSVTSSKDAIEIVVRLYEGKVVVKAIGDANKRLKKDVYLLPGHELVYGKQIFVRAFTVENTTAERGVNNKFPYDNPAMPENEETPYFMFNNQSLGQVLDNLAALYSKKIVYNKKDVQNIYFTGKYNKSESLETILDRIGKLNALTISKKDSAFIISK